MAVKTWLGFGGCKFEKNGITATFTGGVGTPDYVPEQIIKKNIVPTVISRLKGFWLILDIKELYNFADTDYLQYQYLAQIITALIDDDIQQTVTVTPRDDSTITPLSYECILTSNITPIDLHRIKMGQVQALQFTCITLQTSIPTTVGDTTTSDYWDGTNTYWDGSDTYIDDL